MSTEVVATSLSRRDRVRQATIEEMHETARRILVAEGESAVTMSAVARGMGMTPPALYKYVDSHQQLLAGVAVLCNNEVIAAMEVARDEQPADDWPARIMAVSRAFRRWALDHRREFALVFASPEMSARCDMEELESASLRFGWVFGELFVSAATSGQGRLWSDDAVGEDYLEKESDLLAALSEQIGPGGRWQFVNYWARIFGTVSIEVFSHLDWATSNPEEVFEQMLRGIAEDMGVGGRYQHP